MGDTGSMFLGAMLGIITLHLAKTEVGDRSVLVMPLILGVPFCEVFVTVTRRYLMTVMAVLALMLSIGAICILFAPHYMIVFIAAYLLLPVIIMLYRLGFGGRFLKAFRLSKSRYNGYRLY